MRQSAVFRVYAEPHDERTNHRKKGHACRRQQREGSKHLKNAFLLGFRLPCGVAVKNAQRKMGISPFSIRVLRYQGKHIPVKAGKKTDTKKAALRGYQFMRRANTGTRTHPHTCLVQKPMLCLMGGMTKGSEKPNRPSPSETAATGSRSTNFINPLRSIFGRLSSLHRSKNRIIEMARWWTTEKTNVTTDHARTVRVYKVWGGRSPLLTSTLILMLCNGGCDRRGVWLFGAHVCVMTSQFLKGNCEPKGPATTQYRNRTHTPRPSQHHWRLVHPRWCLSSTNYSSSLLPGVFDRDVHTYSVVVPSIRVCKLSIASNAARHGSNSMQTLVANVATLQRCRTAAKVTRSSQGSRQQEEIRTDRPETPAVQGVGLYAMRPVGTSSCAGKGFWGT